MNELKFNNNQINAIRYLSGPLIIVAGAGTGKTTVIASKIKYLIEQNLAKPDEILALTFNEKAAVEMQDRVSELLTSGYLDMNISTFHAFAQKLLENYGLNIGLPNRFKILTQTDAWLLVRKHIDLFNLDYYQPLGNPTRHIHELIKHFSKCKDELLSPESYLAYAQELLLDNDYNPIEDSKRIRELSEAYHVYNRLLLDNNSLDFGDLIYYVNVLFDKRPLILNALKNKFKYILVDEFQDVNWAQYQLVKKISEQGPQLTVVGDDDQSIYAFRGASVANILRFKDDFPTAKEIVLNDNYRSSQQILDQAYNLIQNNNPDRLETKLRINKRLKSHIQVSNNKEESAVIHAHNPSVEDEADFVAKEIIRIKSLDPLAVWDDFAVLVRANNHAEPFINAFEKHSMPYEFLAAAGLFRQPIVIDCVNFLKLIDNYHESNSVYRLLKLPIFIFADSDMQQLAYFAKKKSISYFEALTMAEEIKLTEEGVSTAKKLLNLISEGSKIAKSEKPTKVLYNFIDRSGYLKYLADGELESNRDIIRQIHHLRQFFEYIANYETISQDASAKNFLDHFCEIVDSGELGVIKQPNDTPDSINILTVHTAKGLEYKYVFIVNLVEERFPLRRRGESIEIPEKLINEQLPESDNHYAEERRLLYVAMTRAKNKLYLCSADDYGGIREKKLSRFLVEMNFIKPEVLKQNFLSNSLNKNQNANLKEGNNNFTYELPKTFSFSQIQKYEKCPYQYKLSNILGLPAAGRGSFSFGFTIHDTLEKFYGRLKDLNSLKQDSLFTNVEKAPENDEPAVVAPSLEELFFIYEQCWIPDWYENRKQRQTYFDNGKDILRKFYKENEGLWTLPVSLETAFNIKIGLHTIRGRIDRVDMLPGGGLEIIDYKTGSAKDKIIGEDKEQLLIYQIAVLELPEFNTIGNAERLTYYFLSDNKRLSFLGNEKDISNIKNKITSIIERIANHDFRPTPEKHTCEHCDYKDICDFRV